jgi:sulfatase modifying factor 1
VASFQIGKYEVTWGEWKSVRDWAVSNNKGYDLAGVGAGNGNNFPVTDVNWYDVVKWCNAKSEKEGKTAVYLVSGAVYRSGEYVWDGSGVVEQKAGANGYRLPSVAEWDWAARGGGSSQGYTYSGSNDVNAVAWYYDNSFPNGPKAVGTKAGNELGIYDMSGNVWEWCWYVDDPAYLYRRHRRGGCWDNSADISAVSFRSYYNPDYRENSSFGVRLARSSGN